MSEQNNNHENIDQNVSHDNVSHDNVEHDDSILKETLEEFNPQQNSGEESTIENDIDLDTFKARIAELEGEVKQAKEGTARANAEATMHKNVWSKKPIRARSSPCKNLPKSY